MNFVFFSLKKKIKGKEKRIQNHLLRMKKK